MLGLLKVSSELPSIPAQLIHPLFNFLQLELFPEEMKYYQQEIPWKHSDKGLQEIINRWEYLQSKLEIQFQQKKHGEERQMIEGIALLIKYVFWTNREPVNIKKIEEKLISFHVKPINAYDRLQFILSRPFSFHTFRQIQELMIEQQKRYAVKSMNQKN